MLSSNRLGLLSGRPGKLLTSLSRLFGIVSPICGGYTGEEHEHLNIIEGFYQWFSLLLVLT